MSIRKTPPRKQIQAKLTMFDTTMIVVSLVIGIGIFRTPAMVASAAKTSWLFFAAWALGGGISLLGALTFAEIGSRFPHPGAYYKVVAHCYHSSLAFMLNWSGNLVVQSAGAAAVSMIGAEYLTPILLPAPWQTQLGVQLTCAGLVMVLFLLNYLGIKTGAWTQNILTLFKIVMIVLIVGAALFSKGPGHTGASNQELPGSLWLALAVALISVFYTYGGYQTTINFGADVQKADRNMPRAIFAGILIIISCYLLLNAAYLRILGISGIASAKLVAAEVARLCFGYLGFLIVSLAIFLSALGFVNVTFMHIPRAFYAMAEDHTLPPAFMKVNPKTQTQEFTLTFFVLLVLLSIFFLGTFEKMVNYIMFLDSLNIAIVASTIFVLRKQQKNPSTSYSVPFYPVLPFCFIVFLLGISVNVLITQPKEALTGFGFFLLGGPIFLFLRRVVAQKSPGNR